MSELVSEINPRKLSKIIEIKCQEIKLIAENNYDLPDEIDYEIKLDLFKFLLFIITNKWECKYYEIRYVLEMIGYEYFYSDADNVTDFIEKMGVLKPEFTTIVPSTFSDMVSLDRVNSSRNTVCEILKNVDCFSVSEVLLELYKVAGQALLNGYSGFGYDIQGYESYIQMMEKYRNDNLGEFRRRF